MTEQASRRPSVMFEAMAEDAAESGRTRSPHCGASLSVVPSEDHGAEVRYLCITPADEPHDWHTDRFGSARWKTTPASTPSAKESQRPGARP